jgi:chromosome partitioning protein
MDRREFHLREAVQAVKARFDFILIDCPPSLGLLTLNALTAADSLLIPIQCEYYALEGVTALMNTVTRVQRGLNPQLQLEGVALTMFDGRTNLSLQVADEVKKHFKGSVFSTIIPRSVRLGEAPSHGQPIHEYDPRSAGAVAYQQLAREIIRRNRT